MVRISGATFIRNAIKYQFPVVESIKSLLPICDEVIVNVGKSEDATEELINSIKSEKIKIIYSEWDTELREGGVVLSQQANIAIDNCSQDWIFYLQADEVIHENDYEKIYDSLKKNNDNLKIEALVCDFIHFYGSAWTYQDGRNWYKQEIRIIRNNGYIKSYGDAQGFRLLNGKKPRARLANATVYHYGWARKPEIMRDKIINFDKLWHDDEYIAKKFANFNIENCYSDLDNLKIFTGTHPRVVYENTDLLNLENLLFILQLREKYLKARGIKQKLKGIINRLPVGRYKGFKI
jgi:glycosyltransferase involved in cell wall biosynthesis